VKKRTHGFTDAHGQPDCLMTLALIVVEGIKTFTNVSRCEIC